MNLGKVFYGFTRDGKYRCLWKKNKIYFTEYGNVNATIYFDLSTREEFEMSQVDEETLQPITNLLNGKRKTKRKIIKAYKEDSNKIMDIRQLFYADIVSCESKEQLCVKHCLISKKDANINTVKTNVLCRKGNDCESQILNGGYYLTLLDACSEVVTGRQYLVNYEEIEMNSFSRENGYYCSPMRTKKQIIEMDYRKELKKGVK